MEEVKTSEGIIQCPDLADIGPRTKYWAGVIRDVIRTEEMYMVMAAALEEAFNCGRIGALKEFMFNFSKQAEVIDVEATVVEASSEECEAAGPEPAEPASPDQGGGPSEQSPVDAELLGGVPEGTPSERGDEEKVEA